MKYYTSTTEFNCGIDLHARQMYVCVMDRQGKKLVHTSVKDNDFDYFLKRVGKNSFSVLGSSNAARIAIMAMTTSSSISVNARLSFIFPLNQLNVSCLLPLISNFFHDDDNLSAVEALGRRRGMDMQVDFIIGYDLSLSDLVANESAGPSDGFGWPAISRSSRRMITECG